MAHEYAHFVRDILIEDCGIASGLVDVCYAVFPALAFGYDSAEHFRHELHSVAYAQYRTAETEYFRVNRDCVRVINAVRAAGYDYALGGIWLDFVD